MKIGLDAKRAFLNYTGLGNYSRNIIRSLLQHYPNNEYFLFTPYIETHDFFEEVSNFSNVKIIQPRSKFFHSYWRSYSITKFIQKLELDVYHGLSNELPYNIKGCKAKKIVTIHDLIPFKEDVFRNIFEDRSAKAKMRAASCNSDSIVSISKATKADIIKFLGPDEKKIHVVYQPVLLEKYDAHKERDNQIKQTYQLPQRFLLQVGTVEYRKNIQIILRALKLIQDTDLHFVVVGKRKRFAKSLIDYAKNSGLADRVHFIDPVDDDILASLYRLSIGVVYPSLYEGFGLPIVEAIHFGKPVLTTHGGSFEEAGGAGAYYCDTNNPQEVAAAIQKMLSSDNQHMIALGQRHIEQFNSKAIADALMEIYSK